MEVSVTTPAAPPALRLTLAAERAECTAGTLNPVTWEISGGVEPYRLTVDGASVDADAESTTVTCGTLADGATEAPGTIRATVTDAVGVTAAASAAYTIVEPLPAPVASADVDVMRFSVLIQWRGLTVPASCDVPTGCFAFRTRRAGGTSWEYSWDEHRNAHRGWRPLVRRSVDAGGTTVEAGIASIRDPIEIETPDALRWSATVQATSLTDISGLTATATHDTVTVRWNRQPSADFWYVGIGGAEVGGGQSKFIMDWEDGWGEPTSATHEVTFTDLPPDTEYRVLVEGPEDLYAGPAAAVAATTTVRTAVAPADYTPPLRGPQNLRATATHDTITVRWDHPRTDTQDDYWLRISGPPGRVPIGARDEFVFPPDSAHTYGRLTPGTTYRIRVTHIDITRESAEITITTTAPPPALRLTLTAARSECTAGTLNPLTWTITGGTAPYTLTVDGASVEADAESATGTCGALPEGATEAPGTITAVVTDATGAPATASAAYTIVPPLPAPETPGATSVHPESLSFRWYTAERPPGGEALVAFLVRWREVGSAAWSYRSEARTSNPGPRYRVQPAIYASRDGVAYEVAVAPMRHPLEAETPEALRWTPSQQATTMTYPANVTASSTHDTVTVRWDRQPSVTRWSIRLSNPDGFTDTRITASDAAAWGDPASATHEVTVRHLSPDTEYTLRVGFWYASPVVVDRYVEVPVRTKAAPTGSTPLPRGPQNLRATATATSITVTWDPPFADARQSYRVYLYAPDGDYRAGNRLYTKVVYEPPWTFTFTSSAVNGGLTPWYIAPETTYRVFVQHIGTVQADAEVAITTKAWGSTWRRAESASPRLTCIEYLVGAVICT